MKKLKTSLSSQMCPCIWALLLFSLFFSSAKLLASDSLSYSGRLVNANGSPVTVPVNLKVDLAYTDNTSTPLCTQSFTGVGLTNGVFHLKLDLTCSSNPFDYVLENIPTGESLAIRITDETHGKVYSYQALHSMPLSKLSETSKKLVSMGATDGQVLTWDSGQWKPLAPAAVASGSIGTNELADGSVTDPKVATGIGRAKLATGTPNYVLINDGSGFISETAQIGVDQGGTGASTAAAARANLGIVIGTTAGMFMGADAVPTCAANEKLSMTVVIADYLWDCIPDGDATKLPLAGGQMSGAIDMFTNRIIDVGTPLNPGDAANKAYVDTEIASVNASQWTTNGSHIHFDTGNVGLGTATPAQKLDVIGNIALSGKAMLQSDTANYVELKAPAALASTLSLTLPGTAGVDGYALTTDGNGILSWSAVATTSTNLGGDLSGPISNAQIVAGAIVDADISASAGIAQSKIANLATDLAAKEPAITAGAITEYWRGDKSWQALNTAVVPEATNLYFTESRVLGADLAGLATTAGTVTATDTVLSSIGKLVGNVDAISASQTNYVLKAGDTMSGALSMGSNQITGLADPSLASDAATKNYVDTQVATKTSSQWTTTGSHIYYNSGNVGVGTMTPVDRLDVGGNLALTGKLRLKSDNTNYVELNAPLSLAATLTFVLPGSYGNLGQALISNGAGVLSWSDVATTSSAVGGDLSGTISNAQLVSGAVASAEIADLSIADADIANATITYGKLNLIDGDIPQAKVNGLTTSLAGKEATINVGTTAQYWRGDKTWQALNTSIVPEGSNLYFLDSRVRDALMTGYGVGSALPLAGTDSLLQALGKLEAQIIANDAAFDNTGHWSKNVSDIYFNTGKVGIGTSSPSSTLHVSSDTVPFTGDRYTDSIAGAHLIVQKSRGTAALPAIVQLNDEISTLWARGYDGGVFQNLARIKFSVDGTPGVGDMPGRIEFVTVPDGSATEQIRMTIKNNGYVGIGTTSPVEKLDVNGNIATGARILSGMDGANNTFWAGRGTGTEAERIAYGFNAAPATGVINSLMMRTNGVERVIINSSGSVGIGKTNPAYRLDVAGTGYFNDGSSNIQLLARSDSVLDINNSTGTKRSFSIHHYTGASIIAQWYDCAAGCVQRMAFDTAGNMSIAGTLSQSSDRRLKHEVKPLESSLSKLLKLEGVSYFWKDERRGQEKQIGLIAQDVEKVYPEVIKKSNDGFLSVGYQNLIAPIIEAIRELNSKVVNSDAKYHREIASLKEQNLQLKKQNELFEKRLQKLEQDKKKAQ